MYCSAWRLAPKIYYIMSVQRLIILRTGAMLLETTYRRNNLKPCRKKMIVFAGADNEGPDQPAHPSAYSRDHIRLLLYVHVFCCI